VLGPGTGVRAGSDRGGGVVDRKRGESRFGLRSRGRWVVFRPGKEAGSGVRVVVFGRVGGLSGPGDLGPDSCRGVWIGGMLGPGMAVSAGLGRGVEAVGARQGVSAGSDRGGDVVHRDGGESRLGSGRRVLLLTGVGPGFRLVSWCGGGVVHRDGGESRSGSRCRGRVGGVSTGAGSEVGCVSWWPVVGPELRPVRKRGSGFGRVVRSCESCFAPESERGSGSDRRAGSYERAFDQEKRSAQAQLDGVRLVRMGCSVGKAIRSHTRSPCRESARAPGEIRCCPMPGARDRSSGRQRIGQAPSIAGAVASSRPIFTKYSVRLSA